MKNKTKSAIVYSLALIIFGVSVALSFTTRKASAQYVDRILRPCAAGATPYVSVITLSTGSIALTTCVGGSVTINGIPITPGSGVTGSGTANTVAKWTAATVLGNSGIVDNGTQVGIGTATPVATFNVVTTSGNSMFLDRFGNVATFSIRRANGTIGTPTAVLISQNLGQFSFVGHDGAAFAAGVNILPLAIETWTGSAHGTRLAIQTAATGTTTVATRMEIDSATVGLTVPLTVTQGTITAQVPFISHTATWNNAGIGFENFVSNVTNTASDPNSHLFSWQINGTAVMDLRRDGLIAGGNLTFGRIITFGSSVTGQAGTVFVNDATNQIEYLIQSNSVQAAANRLFGWTDVNDNANTTMNTALGRNASGVVEVNNGTLGTLRDLTTRGNTSISTPLADKEYPFASRG